MTSAAFDSIQFISKGDDYYELIAQEIAKAQSEVLIESYIFDFDTIGKKILHALAAAAQRNIDVRLLVDGIGSYTQITEISHFCRIHRIKFRVYRALPYWNHFNNKVTRFLKSINRRNHRKIVVIDKTKAFVASFNISNVHSEIESGAHAWKDLAVFVQGPEVSKIWTLANTFWTRFPFSMLNRAPRVTLLRIRSTHSMASRRAGRNQVLHRMANAQYNIKILTPYFVPSRRLIQALIRASKRPVEIELILPKRSDFVVVDLAGRHVLRKLLKHKIKVYHYVPSFMHAKGLIIDDWATLGSHNMNHRSLIHDLELDVTLDGSLEVRPLADYWSTLKSSATEITREELSNDSWLIRVLCQFAFWFRNWL